jgi:hypothetical protein
VIFIPSQNLPVTAPPPAAGEPLAAAGLLAAGALLAASLAEAAGVGVAVGAHAATTKTRHATITGSLVAFLPDTKGRIMIEPSSSNALGGECPRVGESGLRRRAAGTGLSVG